MTNATSPPGAPASTPAPRPERLSPIAAIFLRAYEHFGLLLTIEPGADGVPSLSAVRDHIARRLGRAPRLRQRLLPTPYDIAPPVWVDDAEFDIAHHVDEYAATATATAGATVAPTLASPEFRRTVATVFARELDMTRPLWGITLLGTFDDGRLAMLIRVHHALASGMTAPIMFAPVLFDLTPDVAADDGAGSLPWHPQPVPSERELLVYAARDGVAHWSRIAQKRHPHLPRPESGWRQAVRDARRAYTRELGVHAPSSVLNGELSDERSYAFVAHDLGDVQSARAAVPGASVNDVVLACIAGGINRWFTSLGRPIQDVRVQVPVSLVEAGQATFGQSTSFMIVDLPVTESDPVRRLQRITAETSFRKRQGAAAIRALMAVTFRLPGPLRRPIVARVTSERVQNLIVSDIPGPPIQLYFMGGAVSDAFPLMMLSPRHRLRIGALSEAQRIIFGITADPAELGDPQGLADGIDDALAELRALQPAR